MLTQLDTVKARLGLTTTDDDALLTNAILAASDHFDQQCHRTFARTEAAVEEFNADETEICVQAFPIESVASFALKTSETDGWMQLDAPPDFVIRRDCVISLVARLGTWRQSARVIYTGGYVLPGTEPSAGQTGLPSDLEQACVEQVAFWYQNRDALGLTTGSNYRKFVGGDLLESVKAVLKGYERLRV